MLWGFFQVLVYSTTICLLSYLRLKPHNLKPYVKVDARLRGFSTILASAKISSRCIEQRGIMVFACDIVVIVTFLGFRGHSGHCFCPRAIPNVERPLCLGRFVAIEGLPAATRGSLEASLEKEDEANSSPLIPCSVPDTSE